MSGDGPCYGGIMTITAEKSSLPTPDGEMEIFLARPNGTPLGGVVVVQEAFGLTNHIREVCEAVAAAGFIAIAPAMFHRSEDQIFGYDEYEKLGPVIMSMTLEGINTDIDVAIAALEENGCSPSSIGIVGFCMGGSIALQTAARRKIGAAITFYGGGIAKGRFGLEGGLVYAPALQTPWLGFYGDLDAAIPVDEVEQLRIAAASSPVDTLVIRYPDADHGFHRREGHSFNAEASADAWQRAIDFFTEQLA
ncbi:MAG: hypothetical protein RLZZ31_961 [Actinomycetota bacterium]